MSERSPGTDLGILRDRYVPYRGDNTPPYLYAIANDFTDAPSALSFLKWMEEAREERDREMWADARAAGVV